MIGRLRLSRMSKVQAALQLPYPSRPLGRVGEWWEIKLVPAVSVLLATALVQPLPTSLLLTALAELIVSLTIGALFVSLLNDCTDREDDRRSGKPNSFEARPRLGAILLGIVVAAGAAWFWWLSARPFAAGVFLLGWLAYAAYSLPPLRLKAHGLAGMLCDATGAHLVPALLAVALVMGEGPFHWPWLLSAGTWSLAWGVRGIISHQRADEARDRAAGVQTFLVRYGPHRVQWWCRRLLFPIEVAALFAMLVQLPGSAALIALGLALILQLAKVSRFGLRPVLTSPEPRGLPLLHDFYYLFMPLSLILQLAWREPGVGLLILVYPALFPRHVIEFVRDMGRLQSEVLR